MVRSRVAGDPQITWKARSGDLKHAHIWRTRVKHDGFGLPFPAYITMRRANPPSSGGRVGVRGKPLGRASPTTAHCVKLEGLRKRSLILCNHIWPGVKSARPSGSPLTQTSPRCLPDAERYVVGTRGEGSPAVVLAVRRPDVCILPRWLQHGSRICEANKGCGSTFSAKPARGWRLRLARAVVWRSPDRL